jgi:hypothetical protein
VFGGFELAEHHLNDLVDNGYALGVPMGGDLIGSEKAISRAPGFLFAGLKDPNGANLDRVQIIKLWLNANGTTQEKVFDISLSGQRSKGAALVGNTVDIKNGTYTNTIGAAELRGFWKDTEFNPSQPSLYYVRVLEIPTPRYSLLDAIALGVDPKETGRPLTIQERVYSSPIWYTPKN